MSHSIIHVRWFKQRCKKETNYTLYISWNTYDILSTVVKRETKKIMVSYHLLYLRRWSNISFRQMSPVIWGKCTRTPTVTSSWSPTRECWRSARRIFCRTRSREMFPVLLLWITVHCRLVFPLSISILNQESWRKFVRPRMDWWGRVGCANLLMFSVIKFSVPSPDRRWFITMKVLCAKCDLTRPSLVI